MAFIKWWEVDCRDHLEMHYNDIHNTDHYYVIECYFYMLGSLAECLCCLDASIGYRPNYAVQKYIEHQL